MLCILFYILFSLLILSMSFTSFLQKSSSCLSHADTNAAVIIGYLRSLQPLLLLMMAKQLMKVGVDFLPKVDEELGSLEEKGIA